MSGRVTGRAGGRAGGRLLTAMGLVVTLAGVAVLAWLGWQFWGTTWQAQRDHERIAADLTAGWETGAQTAQVAGGSEATALLRIPRFGDDYAVPIISGTSVANLTRGVAHFSESAAVGEVGNYALAGHRITHGEPFRRMPELREGDEIMVETRDEVFVYVLDTPGDGLSVDFSDGWVVQARPVNPQPGGVQPLQEPNTALITLTTCAELFQTDDRLVAFGHLDRVERKQPQQK